MLVLSSNVSASFPFVNRVEGRWTSRYPAQWLIPGALDAHRNANCPNERPQCADIEEALNYARSTTVDDFLAGRPDWVFVDERRNKPYFNNMNFDYIDFFSEDQRFADQWQGYVHVADTAGYSGWRRQL